MANPQNKQNDQTGSTQSGQGNKQGNKSDFNTSSSSSGTSTPTPQGNTSSTSSSGSSSASSASNSPATRNAGTQNTGIGSTGTAAATARSLYDHAKETAGQAYEVVADKAVTKLDEQKSTLSTGLSTVADSVRQVSGNLSSAKTDSGLAEAAAKYTDTAARKLEDVAGYFENKNVRDMARDLEGFARRNPAIFIGAAFGLGLLAARFLKSTPPRYNAAAAGREFAPPTNPDHQLKPASSKSTGDKPNMSVNPM